MEEKRSMSGCLSCCDRVIVLVQTAEEFFFTVNFSKFYGVMLSVAVGGKSRTVRISKFKMKVRLKLTRGRQKDKCCLRNTTTD